MEPNLVGSCKIEFKVNIQSSLLLKCHINDENKHQKRMNMK